MSVSLSSLQRSTLKPPRIIIHGGSGIGKTTFGASSPNPVFILTEDGAGSLDITSFPLAKTFSDVIGAIETLYTEDHDFKTLVLDSLDWVEPIIWAQVSSDHNVKSIEALNYGKGYVEALSYWRTLFDGITALRDTKNMTIIMIAHSQIVRVEDPLQPAYDMHGLKLHKRASALAEEFSDIILFAEQKTLTTTEDTGFNQKRTRALTTGSRVIYAQGSPAFTAKNRYHLPPELPLDWSAFQEAMNSKKPTQPTQPIEG